MAKRIYTHQQSVSTWHTEYSFAPLVSLLSNLDLTCKERDNITRFFLRQTRVHVAHTHSVNFYKTKQQLMII